jgi:hypothetical protein
MSSTNRAQRRLGIDYYVTPQKEIEKFLHAFAEIQDLSKVERILDPCCGGDANTIPPYPVVLQRFGIGKVISTMDIRQDSRADIISDYLCKTDIKAQRFDMIITNPPFNQALPIIQKAINDVVDGGFVIMLLRLNFLESKGRRLFFEEFMPRDIFVHPTRISFTPDGKTDSIAHAHFVWRKTEKCRYSRLFVL